MTKESGTQIEQCNNDEGTSSIEDKIHHLKGHHFVNNQSSYSTLRCITVTTYHYLYLPMDTK